MLYIFLDERYEESMTHSRFIVACSCFLQSRWDTQYPEALVLGNTRSKRQIQALTELLHKTDGFAVLAYADVPAHLARAGEVDGTADIPSMKRRDNVWSQLVLFAVDTTVAWLHGAPGSTLNFDIFYDPKSLTLEHRLAFEKMLRDGLPAMANAATAVLGRTAPLCVQRIEEVPKRKPREKSNVLQEGVHISHCLCSQSRELIARSGVARVVVRDYTDVIINTISQFI